MNPIISSSHRNLLQHATATATATATVSPPSHPPQFVSRSLFNSSLLLTIIVLLAILCLLACFILYMRHFSSSSDSSSDNELPRSRPRSRRRTGVKLADVRRIPVASYGGEMKIWNECSICLSEFEEREFVKVIPFCKHVFHPTCIDTWLSSHVSCPMCRSTELFLAVDEGMEAKDEDRTVEGMHE